MAKNMSIGPKKTKEPLVSVVMSAYNCENYIAAAIESILKQTFTNFEFIIINDGSTDNTLKAIKKYKDPRIVLISRENKGLVASLNEGIARAHGAYIARQDADDISARDRLERQIMFLESHPELGLLGSYFQHISAEGEELLDKVILPLRSADLKARMLFSNAFGHGTVVFRKSVFGKVHGYRGDYGANEDFDLWRRMAVQNEIANLPDILYFYRDNPDGIIASTDESYRACFDKILRENSSLIQDGRTYMDLLQSAIIYRFFSGDYGRERFGVFISDQKHILPILLTQRNWRQAARLVLLLLTTQPIRTTRRILKTGVRKVGFNA